MKNKIKLSLFVGVALAAMAGSSVAKQYSKPTQAHAIEEGEKEVVNISGDKKENATNCNFSYGSLELPVGSASYYDCTASTTYELHLLIKSINITPGYALPINFGASDNTFANGYRIDWYAHGAFNVSYNGVAVTGVSMYAPAANYELVITMTQKESNTHDVNIYYIADYLGKVDCYTGTAIAGDVGKYYCISSTAGVGVTIPSNYLQEEQELISVSVDDPAKISNVTLANSKAIFAQSGVAYYYGNGTKASQELHIIFDDVVGGDAGIVSVNFGATTDQFTDGYNAIWYAHGALDLMKGSEKLDGNTMYRVASGYELVISSNRLANNKVCITIYVNVTGVGKVVYADKVVDESNMGTYFRVVANDGVGFSLPATVSQGDVEEIDVSVDNPFDLTNAQIGEGKVTFVKSGESSYVNCGETTGGSEIRVPLDDVDVPSGHFISGNFGASSDQFTDGYNFLFYAHGALIVNKGATQIGGNTIYAPANGYTLILKTILYSNNQVRVIAQVDCGVYGLITYCDVLDTNENLGTYYRLNAISNVSYSIPSSLIKDEINNIDVSVSDVTEVANGSFETGKATLNKSGDASFVKEYETECNEIHVSLKDLTMDGGTFLDFRFGATTNSFTDGYRLVWYIHGPIEVYQGLTKVVDTWQLAPVEDTELIFKTQTLAGGYVESSITVVFANETRVFYSGFDTTDNLGSFFMINAVNGVGLSLPSSIEVAEVETINLCVDSFDDVTNGKFLPNKAILNKTGVSSYVSSSDTTSTSIHIKLSDVDVPSGYAVTTRFSGTDSTFAICYQLDWYAHGAYNLYKNTQSGQTFIGGFSSYAPADDYELVLETTEFGNDLVLINIYVNCGIYGKAAIYNGFDTNENLGTYYGVFCGDNVSVGLPSSVEVVEPTEMGIQDIGSLSFSGNASLDYENNEIRLSDGGDSLVLGSKELDNVSVNYLMDDVVNVGGYYITFVQRGSNVGADGIALNGYTVQYWSHSVAKLFKDGVELTDQVWSTYPATGDTVRFITNDIGDYTYVEFDVIRSGVSQTLFSLYDEKTEAGQSGLFATSAMAFTVKASNDDAKYHASDVEFSNALGEIKYGDDSTIVNKNGEIVSLDGDMLGYKSSGHGNEIINGRLRLSELNDNAGVVFTLGESGETPASITGSSISVGITSDGKVILDNGIETINEAQIDSLVINNDYNIKIGVQAINDFENRMLFYVDGELIFADSIPAVNYEMFAIGSNNCVISFRNNEEKPDLICNSKGVVDKDLQLSVSNPEAFASVSYHIDEDLTQISASITGDVLTASEIGDVYIYAEGDGQYSDTFKVSIEEKKLVFTNSFADPVVGSSIILSSAFNDGSEATGVEYSITSGGEFASLNGNVLTLNAIGQITIKAQCDGLEVSETINSVPDMNLNISYIGLNNTKDLSVTYNCEVPASSTIGFEIVSGDAATLSGNKLTAVSDGTITIKATFNKGLPSEASKEFDVICYHAEVKPNVRPIIVGETPVSIQVVISDDRVIPTSIEYFVDDVTGSATIDNNGVISGVSAGSIKVYAVIDGCKTNEVSTVVIPKIDIENTRTAYVGGIRELKVMANCELPELEDITIVWELLDGEEFASLDETTGVLTGLKYGTCKVVAHMYADSFMCDTPEYTIVIANPSVVLPTYTNSMIVGDEQVLKPIFGDGEVPVKSSEIEIVDGKDFVEVDGLSIKAVKEGLVTFKIVMNGVTGDVTYHLTVSANHEHVWSDWYLVREATETQIGLEERHCLICGQVEQFEITSDPLRIKELVFNYQALTSNTDKFNSLSEIKELFGKITPEEKEHLSATYDKYLEYVDAYNDGLEVINEEQVNSINVALATVTGGVASAALLAAAAILKKKGLIK